MRRRGVGVKHPLAEKGFISTGGRWREQNQSKAQLLPASPSLEPGAGGSLAGQDEEEEEEGAGLTAACHKQQFPALSGLPRSCSPISPPRSCPGRGPAEPLSPSPGSQPPSPPLPSPARPRGPQPFPPTAIRDWSSPRCEAPLTGILKGRRESSAGPGGRGAELAAKRPPLPGAAGSEAAEAVRGAGAAAGGGRRPAPPWEAPGCCSPAGTERD